MTTHVSSVPVPDLDTIRELHPLPWTMAGPYSDAWAIYDANRTLVESVYGRAGDPHGEALARFIADSVNSASDLSSRLVAVEAERDTLREALERIARPDTWTMQRDRHGQIAWAVLNGVSPDGPVCCRCGATDTAQQCPKGMHHQFVLPPSVVPGERGLMHE